MIELKRTNESHRISLNRASETNSSKASVKLTWEKGVDLDLHAFCFDSSGKFEHIGFFNKSTEDSNVKLDYDAGVGNVAGRNEENLVVLDLKKTSKVIFAANIFRFFGGLFSWGDKFGNYDGKIHFKAGGEEIVVYLNSNDPGRWALISMITTKEHLSLIKNISLILPDEPDEAYLRSLV